MELKERELDNKSGSSKNDFCLKSPSEYPQIRISKWRVRENYPVSLGQIICFYQVILKKNTDEPEKVIHKMKANKVGMVKKRLCKEGDIIDADTPIAMLSSCIHNTVIKDMCADCGADLRQNENGQTSEASIPMIHSIPDLKVTQKLAQKLGRDDTRRLLEDRKLVLLVDLDQTVIHTTNDDVPNNIKGIYHFQLYGPSSPWYHTRLRPGTPDFLEKMTKLYELHICTFGARNYAHTIAQLLDQDGKYFSHRILSRDECFNATSKIDNLKALFPNGDSMVCIIDDREDVWNMASNLIQVKPYHFFQHSGDINAPPGLSKHELDGEGLDFKELETIGQVTDKTADKNNAKQETEKSSDKDTSKIDGEKDSGDEEENDKINKNTQSECGEKGKSAENGQQEEKLNDDNDETQVENDSVLNSSFTQNEITYPNSDASSAPRILLPKDPHKEIEIEDPDDYLYYLEAILNTIHKRFYSIYDETNEIPDLKVIVPKIRSEVLRGLNLVFSGLVPTHMKIEQSRAYFIAKSLGANVTQNIEEDTTHLVAVTAGTFKVNAAKKNPKIHIVNVNWLWTCAERWEYVDEKLFQLDRKTRSKQRQPPAHCHSPEHVVNYSDKSEISLSSSTQQQNAIEPEKFMDTLNPLLVFSNAELADINKEYEQFFESDSSTDDEPVNIENPPVDRMLLKRKRMEKEEERTRDFFTRASTSLVSNMTSENQNESDDTSSNSRSSSNYSGDEKPKKIRNMKNNLKRYDHEDDDYDDDDNENDDDDDDETPSEKFRRGEQLPSDIEMESNSDNSNNDDPESGDDGEWNMMGAALEREFLGLD